jgi:hypothetical protein
MLKGNQKLAKRLTEKSDGRTEHLGELTFHGKTMLKWIVRDSLV